MESICKIYKKELELIFLEFLFKNYILLIMLLQLSQFSPLCLPPSSIPHSLRQSPHHLFMSMGHTYKFFGYSISYTVLYIPMAILFVLLNTFASSHIPPQAAPIWQPSKCPGEADKIRRKC